MKFLLGLKLGMSQMFDKDGKSVPVTLIEAGDCNIVQIKTKEKDGYEAVKIGFGDLKKVKKSQKGAPYKYVKEFRADAGDLKVGDKIDVTSFEEGEKVKISGITKGKGFAGAVKRHGFSGRNATHGVKHEERTIGSVGSAFPQRVIKGKKMPGRMGTERATFRSIKVVKVDKENNLLVVKGAVPGKKGTLLEIKN